MKRMNKKGFTLIELLAVIVILGILMMTAIPAVTRSIAKSRRNTYWQNAKSYVKAATTPYLDGEYNNKDVDGETCPLPGQNEFVVIPQSIVELEQGDITKSSFNSKYVESGNGVPTIIVANIPVADKDNLQWFYSGMDKSKNGIKNLVNINQLGLRSVTTGSVATVDYSAQTSLCVTYSDSKYTVAKGSCSGTAANKYTITRKATCKQ